MTTTMNSDVVTTDNDVKTLLKFKVDSGKFSNALKPAIDIATKGVLADSPYQGLITLESTDKGIDVFAFGGRLSCIINISEMTDVDIDYKFEEKGSATVNAVDFQRCIESFPPSTKVIIENTGQALYVKVASDEKEYQSVPLSVESVKIPKLANKFSKEVSINRAVFLESLKRVGWAFGKYEHREQFLYWRFMATKDFARFSAGDGGLFSSIDVKGSSFLKVEDKVEFFIPNDQTKVVLGIVSKANNNEEITIKQAVSNNDVPSQIVFSLDGITMILVGFESTIIWPDFDNLIKRKRNYRIRTKVSDWEYPCKGISATYTEEIKKQHDTHESVVDMQMDNEVIILTSKTGATSSRKVPIADVLEKDDKSSLSFLCCTSHISDVFGHANKNEDVEIEFIDDESKPIFVIGQEDPNESLKVSYQNILLFGTMKRDK